MDQMYRTTFSCHDLHSEQLHNYCGKQKKNIDFCSKGPLKYNTVNSGDEENWEKGCFFKDQIRTSSQRLGGQNQLFSREKKAPFFQIPVNFFGDSLCKSLFIVNFFRECTLKSPFRMHFG